MHIKRGRQTRAQVIRRLAVVESRCEIPVYRGIAIAMIGFGIGVGWTPDFAFQGDLYQLHPAAPLLYGASFVIGGVLLMWRKPRPLCYLMLTTPLFVHLSSNVVDIVLTSLDRLMPIASLYGLLLFLLIKAYGGTSRRE